MEYHYLVVNLESQVESISFQDITTGLIDEEIQVTKMESLSEGWILAVKGHELLKYQEYGKSGHMYNRNIFWNIEVWILWRIWT